MSLTPERGEHDEFVIRHNTADQATRRAQKRGIKGGQAVPPR